LEASLQAKLVAAAEQRAVLLARIVLLEKERRGLRTHNSGTGRRDLSALPLAEERIEIPDPHLEALVAEGKMVRHGFEETYKLGHVRGGKASYRDCARALQGGGRRRQR
jgi:hypothetical protein